MADLLWFLVFFLFRFDGFIFLGILAITICISIHKMKLVGKKKGDITGLVFKMVCLVALMQLLAYVGIVYLSWGIAQHERGFVYTWLYYFNMGFYFFFSPPIAVAEWWVIPFVRENFAAYILKGLVILLGLASYYNGFAFFRVNPERQNSAEFSLLYMFLLYSILGVFHSVDWGLLFIYFEIFTIALLITIYITGRYSNTSIEASLKYLIIGFFASTAFVLFGLSLIYVSLGTLRLSYNLKCLSLVDSNVLFIGLALVASGLLIKCNVFPYMFWIRDFYEGVEIAALGFFVILSKIVSFYVLFMVALMMLQLQDVSYSYGFFVFIMKAFGVLSVLCGCFLLFGETRIRRFVAYSGVIHMGILVLLLFSNSLAAMIVAFGTLFIYCLSMLPVLSFLTVAKGQVVTLRECRDVFLESGLIGPLATFWFLLSFCGLPPISPLFWWKVWMIGLLYSKGCVFVSFLILMVNLVYSMSQIRILRFLLFPLEGYESRRWLLQEILKKGCRRFLWIGIFYALLVLLSIFYFDMVVQIMSILVETLVTGKTRLT